MPIKNNQIEDKPKVGTASLTAPVTGPGKGAFYKKTVSGVVEGHYVDNQGREIQLTSNGSAIGGSGGDDSGGATTLDELTDVIAPSPTNGNVLQWNGSAWVPNTPSGGGDLLASNNLSDVTNAATALTNLGGEPALASGTAAQYFKGNKTLGTFATDVAATAAVTANTAKVSASGSVGTHSDVNLSGISDGQILKWNNSNSRFEPANESGGGGASVDDTAYSSSWNGNTTTAPSKNAVYDKISLMDSTIATNTAKVSASGSVGTHSDVNLSGISDGQVLAWNNSNSRFEPVNQSSGSGGSVDDTAFGGSWDSDTTTAPSKNAVYDKINAMDSTIATNTSKISASGSVGTHSDVNLSGISDGQVLKWNNSNSRFEPANDSGSASIDDTAYSSSWNGDASSAPSKNAVYDKISTMDSAIAINTSKVSANGSVGTHSDINLSGISDGQILKWNNSNSRFEPADESGGGASVDDTAYSSSWNGDASSAPSRNAVYDKINAMDSAIASNTAKVSANGSVGTHSDVDISGVTDGQVLAWNNSNSRFEPVNQSSGGGSAAVIAASITIPTAGSLSARLAAATGLPSGWSLVEGNNASVHSSLSTFGATAGDVVLIHNQAKPLAVIRVTKDIGGVVQQADFDPASGELLESTNLNQMLLKSYQSGANAGTGQSVLTVIVTA